MKSINSDSKGSSIEKKQLSKSIKKKSIDFNEKKNKNSKNISKSDFNNL